MNLLCKTFNLTLFLRNGTKNALWRRRFKVRTRSKSSGDSEKRVQGWQKGFDTFVRKVRLPQRFQRGAASSHIAEKFIYLVMYREREDVEEGYERMCCGILYVRKLFDGIGLFFKVNFKIVMSKTVKSKKATKFCCVKKSTVKSSTSI